MNDVPPSLVAFLVPLLLLLLSWHTLKILVPGPSQFAARLASRITTLFVDLVWRIQKQRRGFGYATLNVLILACVLCVISALANNTWHLVPVILIPTILFWFLLRLLSQLRRGRTTLPGRR